MRTWILLVALISGCSFAVQEIDVPSPSGPNPEANRVDGGAIVGGTAIDMVIVATTDMTQVAPPDMTMVPALVGDTCTTECAADLTCMTWVPNGYCSRTCDNDSNPCATGSSCVDIGNGTHYCLLDQHGQCARPESHLPRLRRHRLCPAELLRRLLTSRNGRVRSGARRQDARGVERQSLFGARELVRNLLELPAERDQVLDRRGRAIEWFSRRAEHETRARRASGEAS